MKKIIKTIQRLCNKIRFFNKSIPFFYVTINKNMMLDNRIKDSCKFHCHPVIGTLDKDVQKAIHFKVRELIDLIRDNIDPKNL